MGNGGPHPERKPAEDQHHGRRLLGGHTPGRPLSVVRLSGGQLQRVASARALSMQPKVMLFDEPTSALDPELIGEVLETMKQLAIDGTTMIVVTHEIGFAKEVSDRVVFLNNGLVEEEGTPNEVILNPKSERCRQFFSKMLH